jgi:hypothetical protein
MNLFIRKENNRKFFEKIISSKKSVKILLNTTEIEQAYQLKLV